MHPLSLPSPVSIHPQDFEISMSLQTYSYGEDVKPEVGKWLPGARLNPDPRGQGNRSIAPWEPGIIDIQGAFCMALKVHFATATVSLLPNSTVIGTVAT